MVEADLEQAEGLARLNASTAPADVRRIATELLPVFYDQLKRIAHRARTRLGGGHTMQTTALVHEAYLRLGQSRGFADETHFLRAAALAMRHALINHAEARVTEKRGGGEPHVTLSHAADFSVNTDEGLLSLNAAITFVSSSFVSVARPAPAFACAIASRARSESGCASPYSFNAAS